MKLRSFLPKNRSLFYRWLISYVSILLIPVIISGIVNIFSEKMMQDETERANAATLKQIRQTIDEMTASFKIIATQISMNQSLRSVLSTKESYDGSDQYNLFILMKQLSTYISTNGYLANIYIYFKYTDSILSDVNRADAGYFLENYFSGSNMSYEQLVKLLNERHMMDYYSIGNKTENGKNSRAVIFLQSLPLINSGNNLGTLMGVIPEEKIQKIVDNLKWVEQSEFMIIDRNGGELISNGPEVLPFNKILDSVGDNENNEYHSMKAGRNVVASITSDVTGWKYILITPSYIFWEKTLLIRRIASGGILLCILVGGIVAYLLSIKKYDPIENITQALVDKKILPPGNKYREYSFIRTAVNENINEIKTAQSKIEKQYSVLRNSFMSDLLKGNVNNRDSVEDGFSSYGIDFTWTNFSVLLFSIENFNSLTAQEVGISDSDALKMAKYAIAEAVSGLMNEDSRSSIVDMEDNLIAFIINFRDSDATANSKELGNAVKDCRSTLEEKLHISTIISVSNMHEDISEIHEAYMEVKDAMEYRKLIGGDGITKYEDMDKPRYSYDYSIETEQKLTNCLLTGDFDKSRIILEEVFQSNLYDASFSGEMAKCLMFDISSTIVKTMYEVCDIAFIEEIQPIKQLVRCNTVLEMKSHIFIVMKEVCKYVKENGKKNCQLSNAVLEYINSNYHNNNLNVSTMSKDFGITRSYLSKLFKEQTGHYLFDYINRYRVEKAKSFLKDERLSIADTAIKVGYSNSCVFIRTFKKYEGITPGEYKDI